jgi:hypothetical protein
MPRVRRGHLSSRSLSDRDEGRVRAAAQYIILDELPPGASAVLRWIVTLWHPALVGAEALHVPLVYGD